MARLPRNPDWTRDQQLIALRLYIRMPFGRLTSRSHEIIALARLIGRTPGALTMKAGNFGSLDPDLNRKGLSNVSQADRMLWAEYVANPTQVGLEMEEAAARFQTPDADQVVELPAAITLQETEGTRLVRVRRVQSIFRAAVRTSYDDRCAITGLAEPQLLVASHIIPWSESVERRADPTNGILLNALLDRAFDRGLIAFDENYCVLVSTRLEEAAAAADLDCSLSQLRGRSLTLPNRFRPDPAALEHHRRNQFCP